MYATTISRETISKITDRVLGELAEWQTRPLDDFDSYVERHRHFGYYHWNPGRHVRSQFDHKQVRFLRPFGVIDFVPDTNEASRRRNAELAIVGSPRSSWCRTGRQRYRLTDSQRHCCVD